ncbi:MAG: ATP-binding cassette domain-containing protein, partial [Bacteroidota bacterium]
LGVTTPSSGDFLWFGEAASHKQRKKVGSILEKPNFYPNFTAFKNLKLACKIKEVDPIRIHTVLDQVGLLERKDDPFQTYSLGMKQRLAIGSALLAEPKVLILDEPTNGLDPEGIAEIRELILDIAATGKTIILASHLLDEVQKVCTDFAVLRKGNLIHTGKVDDDFSDEVIIEVKATDREALETAIQSFGPYLSHKAIKEGLEMRCQVGADTEALNRHLVGQDIYASHLLLVKKTLEQQFLEILNQNDA